MDTYLVQRCNFRKDVKDEDIKGFDTLVSCDYMGSSEFEWGALPQSLRQIANNLADYHLVKTKTHAKDGPSLMFFCRIKDTEAVTEMLGKLERREVRTKEYVGLKERLAGELEFRPDLWWDIDNHWMAFLGEKNAPRLQMALERFRDRVQEK